MPPSITFLVLFGIKYGDWLDRVVGTSSEDLGSSGIHFVFRHQYYHSIIISVSPNHIIIDLDLIRAPGCFCGLIARRD